MTNFINYVYDFKSTWFLRIKIQVNFWNLPWATLNQRMPTYYLARKISLLQQFGVQSVCQIGFIKEMRTVSYVHPTNQNNISSFPWEAIADNWSRLIKKIRTQKIDEFWTSSLQFTYTQQL